MTGWCDECGEETNLMNGCGSCGAIVCPECQHVHACPDRDDDEDDE